MGRARRWRASVEVVGWGEGSGVLLAWGLVVVVVVCGLWVECETECPKR